jgi:hypothetical protein
MGRWLPRKKGRQGCFWGEKPDYSEVIPFKEIIKSAEDFRILE